MKKILFLVLLAALAVPGVRADTFVLDSVNVSLRSSDPGLVLHWSPDLVSPLSFHLDPGEHTSWFRLFDIWTDENTVNADDEVPYPISVTLNFSQPFASGTVGGDSQGVNLLWGFLQSGALHWNGPAVVPFGNGGQFSIYLQDAYFNSGLLGLWDCDPANIYAKIKYDKAPNSDPVSSVPEPGSLVLLGGGLAMIGRKLGRKKRA